jgi:lysozyme family protein
MSFEKAVRIIIDLEGGSSFTNDPHDNGGATKYGISKRAFPREDIAAMTYDRACTLYRSFYWIPTRCDRMDPRLALCVFDCAVNQGPGAAAGLLQRCLGAKVDCEIGPKTLALLKVAEVGPLISEFMARRAQRYVLSEDYTKYGLGWMSRLFHISQQLPTIESP